jgi:aldehyde oxidoreductase
MNFQLNGHTHHYEGDPEMALLTYLREAAGLTAAKDGCAPQAACGACTVDIDGKARLACVIKMGKLAGSHVTTLEGIGEYRRTVFAETFAQHGAVQCGFCIPGMVMQANALINKNPAPSENDIRQALTPNLCRCTGYTKIVAAIDHAAQIIRHEEMPPAEPVGLGGVGSRLPKYEARRIALGDHAYVDDVRLPGLRYGALKFSEHPRAKIIKIDTSEAEKLAGVLRVFTAVDIPGNRFIGLIKQDWPLMLAEGETTRYLGDVLASVVAESEEIARQAVSLIRVEYEVLEPITDMHEAMKPESAWVHPDRDNVLSQTKILRGDWDTAVAHTAHTASGTYQTQRIEHGFMEPEAAIAYPNESGGVEVLSQSQGVFEDRTQIMKLLGLPADQVRIKLLENGGGFGGKEDLTVQGHAALMGYLLGEPVKVKLNRDESIIMHPKRHPIWMNYTLGCDENGLLTYVQAKFVGDTGAYASVGMKVLERAAGHATGAYHVPAVAVEATAVYTNNLPCGAMRGFGVNQAIFGLESLIDELCEQAGFDRWQFRYDNALTEGKMTATGQILTGGVGVRDTLLAVKEAYQNARYAGLACGLKNTGIGNGMPDGAKVRVTISAPDKVIIDHGWTEMGQGVHTMAIQFLHQETGIDPAIMQVQVDTSAEQVTGMTTASRATSLVGNALLDAAKSLKADLANHALTELVGRVYEGRWVADWTTKPGTKARGRDTNPLLLQLRHATGGIGREGANQQNHGGA